MKNSRLINLAIWSLSIIVFLYFSMKFMFFIYDDSFIIYRYAENLAMGYGFSWNYDGIAEAGFTSYLHTLVIGGAIKLGLDPILFSKILTIISGVVTITIVGFILREFTEKKFDYYFLPSLALAFIPAFGIHSVSGMETIFYVMFFVLSTYTYTVFLRTNNSKHLAITISFLLITSFTRYEAGLLCVGIILHQIYLKKFLKYETSLKTIGFFFIPIFFIGSILLWNNFYLEQLFPNPFYQKSTSEISDLFRNLDSMASAIVLVIVHVFLIAVSFKEIIRNKQSSYILIQIFVILVPFLFISQWGNFLFRYYIPIFPLILALSFFSFYFLKPKIIQGQKHPKFIILLAIAVVIFSTVPSNWEVSDFAISFSNSMESTHIKIGKILGNYSELKHNTIATVVDAGAVPYYSQWRVYDFTFNDRHYSKYGFSADYFYQQNPVILTLNFANSYASDDLSSLEDNVINYLKTRGEPWALHPKFDNFKIVAAYPQILIFMDKEFASKNPELVQELLDNSTHPLNIEN